jgi:hypothetical protein
LLRVEGRAIVCGGCHRRWRAPADLSNDNYAYLSEHARDHQRFHHRPLASTHGLSAWLGTPRTSVECQTCGSFFSGRRCQTCFPDFQLRRTRDPRSA